MITEENLEKLMLMLKGFPNCTVNFGGIWFRSGGVPSHCQLTIVGSPADLEDLNLLMLGMFGEVKRP